MNSRNLFAYALCLALGGALAFLARSHKSPVAHASHAGPDFVLPQGSAVHDTVARVSEELEDGTVRLQDVVDLTSVLLAALVIEPLPSLEELKLPLLVEGSPVGYLRMPPPDSEGSRKWIFEVTIATLPRHQDVADYTDVTVTYSGRGEAITQVTASSETSVHKRASTVAALGSAPHVTGGWFAADQTSSKRCPLTLTVSVSEDPENVSWTSAVGDLVQGEDHLGETEIGSVAGILLSL